VSLRFPRVVVFMLLLAAFSLVACAPVASANNTIQVLATTTIVGDVVAAVGGDLLDVQVLLPAEADPHTFEATPRDVAAISEADLVFISGLGLEAFMQDLLGNVASAPQVIEVSAGIEAIEGSQHEHEGEEHAGEEDEEHSLDPHVWQDPNNVMTWAENIANALAEKDPANADAYQANAAAYIAELQELDSWIAEETGQLSHEQRILVTDHEALSYFAQRYDFEIVGVVIPSVSTLESASAQALAELQHEIEEHNAPAIFVGTSLNPDTVAQFASDLGVQVVPIYAEALSDADGPAATYLEMMRYNVEAIVGALQ
jgi:ABC-type Zn uptake system ZnuABC Zn-binding protein ZnuA